MSRGFPSCLLFSVCLQKSNEQACSGFTPQKGNSGGSEALVVGLSEYGLQICDLGFLHTVCTSMVLCVYLWSGEYIYGSVCTSSVDPVDGTYLRGAQVDSVEWFLANFTAITPGARQRRGDTIGSSKCGAHLIPLPLSSLSTSFSSAHLCLTFPPCK